MDRAQRAETRKPLESQQPWPMAWLHCCSRVTSPGLISTPVNWVHPSCPRQRLLNCWPTGGSQPTALQPQEEPADAPLRPPARSPGNLDQNQASHTSYPHCTLTSPSQSPCSQGQTLQLPLTRGWGRTAPGLTPPKGSPLPLSRPHGSWGSSRCWSSQREAREGQQAGGPSQPRGPTEARPVASLEDRTLAQTRHWQGSLPSHSASQTHDPIVPSPSGDCGHRQPAPRSPGHPTPCPSASCTPALLPPPRPSRLPVPTLCGQGAAIPHARPPEARQRGLGGAGGPPRGHATPQPGPRACPLPPLPPLPAGSPQSWPRGGSAAVLRERPGP